MRLPRFLSARVLPLLLAVLFGAAPVSAQEPVGTSGVEALQPPLRIELRPAAVLPQARESKRPTALLPLYGSLAALQGLDIHSTRRGMTSGKTREGNPIMGGVVNNGAAFVAVKAAATLGAIWGAEKLWKTHPKRAVAFAVVLNAAMAAVVAHNYRLAK